MTRRDALRRDCRACASTLLPPVGRARRRPAIRTGDPLRRAVCAGGFPDTVARILAQRLDARLGQSVIIDTAWCERRVAGGRADLAPAAPTSSCHRRVEFSITADLLELTYDPKGISCRWRWSGAHRCSWRLSSSANDLKGFLEYVKSQPGKVNYGSYGIGARHHLTVEAMKTALGLAWARAVQGDRPAGAASSAARSMRCSPPIRRFRASSGWTRQVVATNAAQRSSLAPISRDLRAGARFDFAPIVVCSHWPERLRASFRSRREIVAVTSRRRDAADGDCRIDPVGAGPDDYAKAIATRMRMGPSIKAAGISKSSGQRRMYLEADRTIAVPRERVCAVLTIRKC